MKKRIALLLVCVLTLGLLVTPSAFAETTKTYNGQDVSEPVELVLYYIGNTYTDQDLIVEKINEVLQEKINATLVVKNIGLSDYSTKYSLTIAGGSDIDLIYTSTWAFYLSEANKGAFTEVTDDIISKDMPLHVEYQNAASWGQASISGKVYFIPCNAANVNANAIVIRGDLREKYGLDKLETIDDLAAYYAAVAADEDSGVQYAYNASQNNDTSKLIMLFAANNWVQIAGNIQNYFSYEFSDDFSADDIFWIYSTPEYLEYAKSMKEWADSGYWSKSAIANATDTKEAFLNGTSASYSQNLGTVGSTASTVMVSNPEWQPEIYDLTPDADRFFASFVGDGYAVLESSKNKDRAFMALDLMKFDEDLYNIIRYGIEGDHYNKVGDDYWEALDNQDAWPFGNALSWGFKNNMYERDRVDMFSDQVTIGDLWKARAIESPTATFAFDNSNVQNELANLQSVYTQYIPLLDLGLVDDVEATLAEFQKQAELAGLSKIQEEVQRQIQEFVGE